MDGSLAGNAGTSPFKGHSREFENSHAVNLEHVCILSCVRNQQKMYTECTVNVHYMFPIETAFKMKMRLISRDLIQCMTSIK